MEKSIHPNFDVSSSENIFEITSTNQKVTKIRLFEPEIKNETIIVPIEITDERGLKVTFGIPIDRQKLTESLSAYEFDDIID